ncbi:hypothetical protein S7711_10563 [Stachybotrys chartarum IBT 7711]|uniref:Uncharacterized protein n=1 Tax=Stachybotrys chartarum (strain CBS 109288 / IBT 7711) TaxID=1280523 RepID=A0A084B0Y3_STACB|nr:hypothetical protein S7711_10563 [Stachybotrys chartarum IBT 7711]KFA56449.1 hypothetical protein S40293_10881 [Stachybotrys chartarum IBT 40293]
MENILTSVNRVWTEVQSIQKKLDDILRHVPPQIERDPSNLQTVKNFEERIRQLELEKQNYAQQLAHAQEKLHHKLEDLKILEEKEFKFRNIILDKAGTQKIGDSEVITAFVNVRQRAQGIIQSTCFHNFVVDKSLLPSGNGRSDTVMRFYRTLDGLTKKKDRLLRGRSIIFRLLLNNILDENCFGIYGINLHGQPPIQPSPGSVGVEAYLGDFENLLKDSGVPSPTIVDWRIETLRCIGMIYAGQDGRVMQTAECIYDCLLPMIHSNVSRGQLDVLKDDIRQLCEDTFHLRMMMRQSKEDYSVWRHSRSRDSPEAKLSNITQYAEEYDVEDGKGNDRSDHVAYTLFGGLVKYPEYRGEGVVVLEKAQIVLKRESSG